MGPFCKEGGVIVNIWGRFEYLKNGRLGFRILKYDLELGNGGSH